MVETFEQMAHDKGWYFDYGTEDFQNLLTLTQHHDFIFLLFPLQEQIRFNPYGVPTSKTHIGAFALLKGSQLFEVYHAQKMGDPLQGRYLKYIKPCKEQAEKIPSVFCCCGLQVNQWELTEVINFLDANLDGVWVKFQIAEQL